MYHNLKILTEGPCKIYNLKSYPIKIKQMTENNTNILLMKAENKNYWNKDNAGTQSHG